MSQALRDWPPYDQAQESMELGELHIPGISVPRASTEHLSLSEEPQNPRLLHIDEVEGPTRGREVRAGLLNPGSSSIDLSEVRLEVAAALYTADRAGGQNIVEDQALQSVHRDTSPLLGNDGADHEHREGEESA